MQLKIKTLSEGERAKHDVSKSYRLDELEPEAAFDHVVQRTSDLFDVPTAMGSVVEEHEMVIKGRVGFDSYGTARDEPFCTRVVKAVIALGASLDVIAEGVKMPEQASALVGFGCREAQCYLFRRPMPAAAFEGALHLASESATT